MERSKSENINHFLSRNVSFLTGRVYFEV